MLNQVITLSNLTGVSSWEDKVRDYLVQAATAAGCQVRVDALGNVIAHKSGTCPGKRKIMLTAHMDEVGLMVTGYEEDGCLRFDLVGELDRRCLIGKRMLVGGDNRPGVIGIKAIHLTSPEERKKAPATRELYLDMGAESREEAQRLAPLGTVCAFVRSAAPFGQGLVKAPALTSRMPCAILLALMERELPVDVTFAFTVQQEVGSRGAFGLGFSEAPDLAIVVDGLGARDYPGAEGSVPKLGGGPVLSLMDQTTLYDRSLFAAFSQLAQEKGIAIQCQNGGTGTQADAIQRSRAGVPVLAVKVPVRYENTPANVAALSDCEQAEQLLLAFLEQEAAV